MCPVFGSTRRQLSCTNGCRSDRFEALNAPVFVDAGGRVVDVGLARATYLCTACGGVALDIAAAGREMRAHGHDEAAPEILTCPGCGTGMLPPEDDPLADVVECPVCEQRFGIEEGRRLLLGGTVLDDRDEPD